MKSKPRSQRICQMFLLFIGLSFSASAISVSQSVAEEFNPSKLTPKSWVYTKPLVTPEDREVEPSRAQKDPTVVYHDGAWHLFMTVKLPGRSAIEYCSFSDWEEADTAERTLLDVSDSNYFCAAQVFYFRPHKLWYLIYQDANPSGKKMRVAYSTTQDISDPHSWTKSKAALDGGTDDPRQVGGLDYWVICDDTHAYLFFTSLNGKMWRMKTSLEEFPNGFDDCQLALEAEIFEASHTYRIDGTTQFLTLIEQKGRRYFKAYLADRLDGDWTPLADSADHPFASWKNIRPAEGVTAWTDNVSHGELVRLTNDETLTIDPNKLQFVFQGMFEKDKHLKGYGDFNWKIGILTPDTDRR
ncbi:Alpha-L-arabinofuranosidase C precursor [Thalassoglobus neptunius]|uniref:non-reducing end alpha-L-arabinofuranosidase n=2 Tax=Thalassoglobus neptunius TaxID=1938619 RepID=A0A5C5X4X3_9PLAN|nr:Alpha-L-arabinofuranosidase C precursor [Thalassoglobus neptunius]